MISLRAFEPHMTSPREIQTVEHTIHLVRGQRVMVDSDLAAIYGVTPKRLNEQLRRNSKRFPSDFAFQLTRQEFTNLKSQIATSSSHGGKRKLPWVFTEHGAIMLASVLNSDVAVEASVRVVRAFVRLREIVSANAELAAKFAQLERRLDSHDDAIAQLFEAIRQLLAPPPEKKREIGFHVRERAGRYAAKGKA
ncbi:MAG TPA: ORF6N domain-containing protein [Chthoniobacterales bacterium]|nr:ORF6N domain-containing protein [Chthoniobacterales bacterium]